MRDKKRIEPFLIELQYLWELNPDLRFGQLIYLLAEYAECGDIFFPEEDVWLEAIRKASIPDYSSYALNR